MKYWPVSGSSAGVKTLRDSGWRISPVEMRRSRDLAFRAARRVLPVEGHETAIDDDISAGGELQRGQHQKARRRARRRRRAERREPPYRSRKLPSKCDMAVFIVVRAQMRPLAVRAARGCGDALARASISGDQTFLPGEPVQLPDAEETRMAQPTIVATRRQRRRAQAPSAAAPPAASRLEPPLFSLGMILLRDEEAFQRPQQSRRRR